MREIENKELFNTVETILMDLTSIVVNNQDLPRSIIDSYLELQAISQNIEGVLRQIGLSPEMAIIEMKDIYQDIIDEYVLYLENRSKLF